MMSKKEGQNMMMIVDGYDFSAREIGCFPLGTLGCVGCVLEFVFGCEGGRKGRLSVFLTSGSFFWCDALSSLGYLQSILADKFLSLRR